MRNLFHFSTKRGSEGHESMGAPSWLRRLLGASRVGVRNATSAAYVSGHDFSRAEQSPKKKRALAPEGRISGLARYLILPLVIVVSVMTLGSADTEARYQNLGHKLMCPCGCSEILIECNHVGCPDSDRMLGELRAAIDLGSSDNAIFVAFQDKYGPTALASPMLTKFNIVAWVVPPGLLILGLAGTFLLVKKWRLRTAPMPVVENDPASNDLRDRIRKETEV
jgi:cytochrome c-type biogenesis protein CcmH